MSAIKIENLVKDYRGFKAVNGLSIEVGEKRIFGFLGPNGAGKTTTIRMLAGLIKPTSGQISICDKPVKFGDFKTNQLFGYLPEQPSFYNWMTGEQYLGFVADIFKLKPEKKKKQIDYLLGFLQLGEARKKRIGTYSNGMKQRLGIAQALINDPEVLILDEPVSALDPVGRKEVLEVLDGLRDKMTIFMSTHILSDVDRICDEVAIINHGQLIVQSSLRELKERYAGAILEVEFKKPIHKIVVEEIARKSWARKVIKEGNTLRIWLDDEKSLDNDLPIRTLGGYGLGILRYGLNMPQVEDLFIDAMEQK